MARRLVREQIAFYASTPTYRVVLACHGWEAVGEQLSRLAAMKRWSQMSALISDEMLDVFAVQAPLDRIGAALRARYAGVLDRVFSYVPYVPGELDGAWREIAAPCKPKVALGVPNRNFPAVSFLQTNLYVNRSTKRKRPPFGSRWGRRGRR